jgi:hypothetical protein
MATNIKIVVLETHDVKTLNVADASQYPSNPPVVTNPTLLVTPPGFPVVSIAPFIVNGNNILTSDMLKITAPGLVIPLPDGVYHFNYSIAPSATYSDSISFMRVNKLQEKFDRVFMTLDMMECDREVKTQAKVQLNTIYLLIQGAIAAANNCATIEANKLYDKASAMLNAMTHNNCGCSGNNFIVNFK